MPFDAVVSTDNTSFKHITSELLPPFITGATFKEGQGTIPAGTILSRDAQRLYVPYVSGTPKAVLLEDIDTTKQTVARIQKFGSVHAENILVAGAVATQEHLDALESINIYS